MIERSGDVLSLIAEWAGIFAGVVVDAAAQISQPGRVHRLDLSHRSLLPALRAVPPMPSALPRLSSLHAAWTARHLIAYLVEGELFDVGTPLSPVVAEAADELVERIIVELARVSAARQAEGAAEHA
jgi:hydrogenase maturation protease